MPTPDIDIKSSWADDVDDRDDEDGTSLPEPTETFKNGIKTVTEYKINEDGKKVKIVRQYKIEKRIVSKSIANRKTWHKFGDSFQDKAGPNPATTVVAEDVYMQFITNKEETDKPEEDALDKLRGMDQGVVKCRICKGDHWTTKCPFKDTVAPGGNKPAEEKKPIPGTTTAAVGKEKSTEGKYVPPSMRDGANKHVDSMANRGRDDTLAIRISNLSESTQEQDLEDLVKPFGQCPKLYLAKDRNTNTCKGFAYVHFKYKTDAANAIRALNGFGYDHLILSVDWSKPAQN